MMFPKVTRGWDSSPVRFVDNRLGETDGQGGPEVKAAFWLLAEQPWAAGEERESQAGIPTGRCGDNP